MLEEGGTFSSPTHEDFNILVSRANDWLVSHRDFDVLNVECVEILTPHNTKIVDPNKGQYDILRDLVFHYFFSFFSLIF
jgi:hypothetical protein